MGKELAVILNHNGVEIVADPDNLTSLTALWKAAGGRDRKRPAQWLRTDAATEFIDSLASRLGVQKSTITKSRRGKNIGGVWAHWQVAMAFAKWLSPEFHQAVNEGFRRWFEEEQDPSLKIERGVEKHLARGATAEWVKSRFDGIVDRKEFCATLQNHNCRQVGSFNPYRAATESVNLAAVGKTSREFKADKGLPQSASTRDHMTRRELTRLAFLESEATAVIRERAADGNEECLGVVKHVCDLGKATFRAIESNSRQSA